MLAAITRKGLARNSIFAVGQNFIVAASLFLSYRILIEDEGMARMGLWSLLLAFGSFARVADVSGVGALGRFVAVAYRDEDQIELRNTVHTVLLTSIAINIFFGYILFLLAPVALIFAIDQTELPLANALIPWVIANFILGAISSGVSAGLDGMQRADQRAIVVSISGIIFFICVLLMVPSLGVEGFALALVLQHFITIIFGWAVLRRHVLLLGWLPLHWNSSIFRSTTLYSLKLNAIGIISILFEPLAKAAFNHAGGTAQVAVYELASRMVTQIRSFVIAAATPMVPAIAATKGQTDPDFILLIEQSARHIRWVVVLVALLSLIGAPILSFVVLGKLSSEVLSMNSLLTLGWSINIFSMPLYLAGQGLGILRWNFISHVVIAISVLLSAIFLVPLLSSMGVIVGTVTGLILGTLAAMIGNAWSFGCMESLKKSLVIMLYTSAGLSVLCLLTYYIYVS